MSEIEEGGKEGGKDEGTINVREEKRKKRSAENRGK